MSLYPKMLLVEKVYLEIKKLILAGEYLPGKRLIEEELAKKFQVSKVTLREALRRLIVDDLVVLIPNRGIQVKELSYKEKEDIYIIRERVEGLAAWLAAQVPKKRLYKLEKICLEGAVAVSKRDRNRHRTLNNQFHREVASVADNEALIKIIERLNTQIIGDEHLALMSDLDLENSQKDHEQILQAILGRDSEKADLLMRDHIRNGLKYILLRKHRF